MDFTIKINIDGITETASYASFPVQAYDAEGKAIFPSQQSIPIRLKFYHQLRATKDWRSALEKIIKGRIAERIDHLSDSISINDKLKLL
jgi:hypothetical protein